MFPIFALDSNRFKHKFGTDLNFQDYNIPDEHGKTRRAERGRVSFRSPIEFAFRKGGLPKIKFDDLRHIFASNFVMKGKYFIPERNFGAF